MGFYKRALAPGDLAFDIGALNGDHTAAMLARGARVVAVEPQFQLATSLAAHFSNVTVVHAAVGDRSGKATLLTSSDHAELSTLHQEWAERHVGYARWDGTEQVEVRTLDDLIAQFGEPTFVKIDSEGFEDRILAGLTLPVGQLLFEVHSLLHDVAAAAFARLAELGPYEYRVMSNQSWIFGPVLKSREIIDRLPHHGDVHARLSRRG